MKFQTELQGFSSRIKAKQPRFHLGQVVSSKSLPFGQQTTYGIVIDIGIEVTPRGDLKDINYLVAFPDQDDLEQCVYWTDELLPETDLIEVEVAA